mmetsp:Transcript_42756/g.68750  ORF Transcript_42756/g.68750 Transcript_42756/m.68750 type:complete len:339 (+) Transcript_42756:238-1254(+)
MHPEDSHPPFNTIPARVSSKKYWNLRSLYYPLFHQAIILSTSYLVFLHKVSYATNCAAFSSFKVVRASVASDETNRFVFSLNANTSLNCFLCCELVLFTSLSPLSTNSKSFRTSLNDLLSSIRKHTTRLFANSSISMQLRFDISNGDPIPSSFFPFSSVSPAMILSTKDKASTSSLFMYSDDFANKTSLDSTFWTQIGTLRCEYAENKCNSSICSFIFRPDRSSQLGYSSIAVMRDSARANGPSTVNPGSGINEFASDRIASTVCASVATGFELMREEESSDPSRTVFGGISTIQSTACWKNESAWGRNPFISETSPQSRKRAICLRTLAIDGIVMWQ